MSNQVADNQIEELLPEAVLAKRRELSRRYLKGEGIETGALHLPLWVPETAKVRYVDRFSVDDLRHHYPELNQYDLVDVDIVDNGEELATIANHSLDFIIANHFLEHCENPLGAIRSHLLKLRQGGVLYYAVPDKHLSFDQHRPLTDFAHLVRDDREGIETSRLAHYREWAELICSCTEPDEIQEQAQKLLELSYSIHFHVWDFYAFSAFLIQAQQYLDRAFEVEELQHNQTEIVAVLRKVADPQPPIAAATLSGLAAAQPPAWFNYCVDFPAPHQEILLPHVLVSGWITAAPNSTIAQPVLCDATRSYAQPLAIVARPDVSAAFPQQQAIGFRQLLSTLDLPTSATWQIEFLLNGSPQAFPCPFSLSAETLRVLRTRQANKLARVQSVLQCPACGSPKLQTSSQRSQCPACQTTYSSDRRHQLNFLPDAAIDSAYPRFYDYDAIALSLISQHPQGLILDLSSGLSTASYENVIRFGTVPDPVSDVLGRLAALPFQTSSFDAVLLLAAEPNSAPDLSELLRVLKPSGRLYAIAG